MNEFINVYYPIFMGAVYMVMLTAVFSAPTKAIWLCGIFTILFLHWIVQTGNVQFILLCFAISVPYAFLAMHAARVARERENHVRNRLREISSIRTRE